MDLTYVITPGDSRTEVLRKIDNRLKYYIDSSRVTTWLREVCAAPIRKESRCILLHDRLKFISLIEQECMKSELFKLLDAELKAVAIERIERHFLIIEEPYPDAVFWWTRAGKFSVSSSADVKYMKFISWNYGIPGVFRDIAEQFFNFEYGNSQYVLQVQNVEGNSDSKLEMPRIPYRPGFYTYHCDLLYQELDEVSPCQML